MMGDGLRAGGMLPTSACGPTEATQEEIAKALQGINESLGLLTELLAKGRG